MLSYLFDLGVQTGHQVMFVCGRLHQSGAHSDKEHINTLQHLHNKQEKLHESDLSPEQCHDKTYEREIIIDNGAR